MGGPNLEIFKFSLYLFVPLAALVHFGDPQWYRDVVVPVRVLLLLLKSYQALNFFIVSQKTVSTSRPYSGMSAYENTPGSNLHCSRLFRRINKLSERN